MNLMPDQTLAHAFPLIRGGGLFICIVGAAMGLGALKFEWRNFFLAGGALIAAAATALFAASLAAPFGAPTILQIGSLVGAVVIEMAALAWAVRTFARKGQRSVTIAILIVVGLHFVLMAPAFGPLVALLGVLTAANAALGLMLPRYSLPTLWLADGALKFGFGAAMLQGQMLPNFLYGPG